MSRIGDYFKRVGRKAIPIHEKYVTRYARPAVTAAASYILSPVVGEAFNAATHHAHQAVAGVTQRAEGKSGLEARQKARAQANRTTNYGHAAAALGAIASGITLAAQGESFFEGLAGQGGAKLLGSTSTIYGSETPLTNLGELGTPIGTTPSVYGSQLSSVKLAADASAGAEGEAAFVSGAPWTPGGLGGTVFSGGEVSSGELVASPAGSSIWGDLAKTVGTSALGKVAGSLLEGRIPGQNGGGQGGAFGGTGGQGGDLPGGGGGNILDWLGGGKQQEEKSGGGLFAALAIGALLVFGSK